MDTLPGRKGRNHSRTLIHSILLAREAAEEANLADRVLRSWEQGCSCLIDFYCHRI
jgi:hypothetical protein